MDLQQRESPIDKIHSMDHGINPFTDWASIVDCGDISNSPFDKLQAIHELEAGWTKIASRKPQNKEKGDHVRLISIGGDHTISKILSSCLCGILLIDVLT